MIRRMLAVRTLLLFVMSAAFLAVSISGIAQIVTTPVSPKLVSPGSPDQKGSEVATLTPQLRWEPVFDASLYSIYVRKFPFTESDVVFKNEAALKPPLAIPDGLLADGERYRWYARAFNKAGWSDKSQNFHFVVNLPSDSSAPALLEPGSAAKPIPSVAGSTPTFRWKSVPTVKRYGLYVSKYPYGAGHLVYRNESLTDTSFTIPKGVLFPGQTYRWTIRGQTKSGWSDVSQRLYFKVKEAQEKTAGKTPSKAADLSSEKAATEKTPSPYPVLPNDVIVEGELQRTTYALAGSHAPQQTSADGAGRMDHASPPLQPPSSGQTDRKLLAQRAMPSGLPSRFGAEQPQPPPSSPPPTTIVPQPKVPTLTPVPSSNQAQGQAAAPDTTRPSTGAPAATRTAQAAPPPPSPPASPPPFPSPRPANATPATSAGSMVQMQFDNIELRDLVKFVSNIMGKNFIFDDNVVKGKATILSPKSLTRDEVFRVFESVLNYYGFSVVQTPEAIKIVKSADAKTLAIESLDPAKVMNLPPEERVATLVQPLEYLDSNTMVGIMRPLMSRDAYLVSVPATNSLIMIDTAANLQRLKKLVAELDIPVSKQLSAITVYNVQHTTAADLAKTLQALLAEGKKAATPKEKIFITSYAPTNSLLVSAPPEDMQDIRRIIEEIDTLRPQVLVEAAIMEVSLTKGASLGVEWVAGTSTGNDTAIIGGVINPTGGLAATAAAIVGGDPKAAATAMGSLSGFSIGVVGNSITFNGKTYPGIGAFVRAVASESSVNILSTPQILTMNNEEAEIVVGENRPYITSSRLDSAGNPINSFDYRDVGVKLKVKPYINKDGLVYLTLYQEVTKVTEATVGSGSSQQPAPTTLKRSTKTTVGVKDSQTIVISGLIKDDSEASRQGIPFLSAIPVIGWLFGSQTRAVDKTNLLVFITPRIIYSSQTIENISRQKQTEQEQLIKREKNVTAEKVFQKE